MKELKTLLEEKLAVSSGNGATSSWSKEVPKKVVILIWRVKLGRIPVRQALDKRGLDLHPTLCPRCEKEVESVNHTLFQCEEVHKVWQKMARWWSKDIENFTSLTELLASCDGIEANGYGQKFWKEAV